MKKMNDVITRRAWAHAVQMMIATTILLLSFLLTLSAGTQQNTPVLCYSDGSANCTSDGTSMMTYGECCTQQGAENISYSLMTSNDGSTGECTICGPVFLEEESYPSFVTASVLVIEWALHPDSIGVSRYQSLYYVEGESTPEQAIPLTFDPPASSQQFLALTVGVTYVISVRAQGTNGGVSELKFIWEAGKSHLPTFFDFAETESTFDSVTAEWRLQYNGVFPMEQMTVRWRVGTDELENVVAFPDENVVTFSYISNNTLSSGAIFSHTFQDLRPATVYVVQLEGRNRLGTSSTNFIIETGDPPSIPSQVGVSNAGHSLMRYSKGWSLLLLACYILLIVSLS